MKTVFIEQIGASPYHYHEFGFVDFIEGKYIQKSSSSHCRSFMCDVLFLLKNRAWKGMAKAKYTFNYDKGNIYILVGFTDTKQMDLFISNIPKLQEKEKQAKVRACKVYKTQEENVLLVEGSKYWKDSCWKMMLYTFYIKTFGYTNPKEIDKPYWAALGNGNEEQLLSKVRMSAGKEIFDDSVYKGQREGYHDKEGFVSICSGRNPPMATLLGVKLNKIY